jgi:hypothetical protein
MQVKGVVQSLNIYMGGGLVIFERLRGGLVICRNNNNNKLTKINLILYILLLLLLYLTPIS